MALLLLEEASQALEGVQVQGLRAEARIQAGLAKG
jgi:hypothetical protein